MVRRLVLALVLILLMVPSALGDLNSVKRAIKEKRAKWEAGETSVSRMTEPELRRMLGSKLMVFAKVSPASKGKNKPRLPKEWDWRDAYGAKQIAFRCWDGIDIKLHTNDFLGRFVDV